MIRSDDSFHDILRFYESAGPEDRAGYILNHFSIFSELISQIEKAVLYQIREESRFNRRDRGDDLGVRIQKSVLSNPTQDEAIEYVELERAFRTGDLSHVLRFADDPDRHRQERNVVEEMRRDFTLIHGQIQIMRKRDRNLLLNYLEEEITHMEIAEEQHIQYESAKVKISRLKRQIRCSGAKCIADQVGNRKCCGYDSREYDDGHYGERLHEKGDDVSRSGFPVLGDAA